MEEAIMNSLGENLKYAGQIAMLFAFIIAFVLLLGKGIHYDTKKTQDYNLEHVADHMTEVCVNNQKMYYIQTSRGSEAMFYKLDEAGLPIPCKGD